ncbi:MAG: response regulator [Desulfobacteraceae bacterium]
MDKTIDILLIDDETEFISALAERLKIRGYQPQTADSGETGLTMIASARFDIVVLDLMMPGLSGLETLKQIRAMDSNLPVILLTGHGSTRDGLEGMRMGARDYLMKPLDINDLIDKISSALNH